MKKQRVVVVCPGRGSYSSETLGYLNPYKKLISGFIEDLDQRRVNIGEPKVSELDQALAFDTNLHERGEHAAALIYACAYADFQSIDREKYEIVAITGNSMGWYLALAFSGGLNQEAAFKVIQTMGAQMRDNIIGGQVMYPVVDSSWRVDQRMVSQVEDLVEDINARDGMSAYCSIYLGGYRILGGNEPALKALLKELPTLGRYPIQLVNHAAFHTPLLEEVSRRALMQLPAELFAKPKIPVIDGRGVVWTAESANIKELHQYTLGHQVVKAYNFTQAISCALNEFSPDKVILLGPGNKIGGPIAQTMIMHNWQNIKSRADFKQRQKTDPFLISMGRIDQRGIVGRHM